MHGMAGIIIPLGVEYLNGHFMRYIFDQRRDLKLLINASLVNQDNHFNNSLGSYEWIGSPQLWVITFRDKSKLEFYVARYTKVQIGMLNFVCVE